jgi:two-component system response regulator YesN
MANVRDSMGKTFEDLEAMALPDDQQNFLIYLLLLPTRVLTNVRSGEKGSYDNQRKLLERFLYCADLHEQKLLLLQLYEEVTVLLNNRSEAHPNYIIERVRQIIKNRFMEQLSIASLAEEVYLTPTYLCALFKQATGQTVNEFITLERIDHAKELLANPHIKLYDVCYQVGYLSPSYFSKLFKKYTRMTPSEYREASLHQD